MRLHLIEQRAVCNINAGITKPHLSRKNFLGGTTATTRNTSGNFMVAAQGQDSGSQNLVEANANTRASISHSNATPMGSANLNPATVGLNIQTLMNPHNNISAQNRNIQNAMLHGGASSLSLIHI